MNNRCAPLAVTMGDPLGIGIEITGMSWLQRKDLALPPFYLVGHLETISRCLSQLESGIEITEITDCHQTTGVFDTKLPVFQAPSTEKIEGQVIRSIDLAVDHCLKGLAGGLITNPIHKKRLYDAGFTHPGHTEYLATLTNRPGKAVMMLACDELKVVPATVHIPLSKVSQTLTAGSLKQTIETTHRDLADRFAIPSPRIVVAGLNPHAGEDGSIGNEEVEILKPVIADFQKDGLDITGPFPADSLFHPAARAKYDAAICMYHDQALVPLKTIDFDNGVNVTLGLPIIRTSPDHGTADDIAGKGIANPASLIAAIKMAAEMSGNAA